MKKLFGLELDNLFSNERSLYAARTTFPFFVMAVIGYVFILIYSASFTKLQFIAIFGSSTLIVGGFLLTGTLFGFLFGVPRTIQSENNKNTNDQNARSRIEANTNLEQISDWLTKILVGVGLTQLKPILKYTKINIIDNLTSSFGSNISQDKIAIATSTTIGAFVYFSVCGFFIGYLWSRVYLTQSLEDEYNREFIEVKKEVDKTKLFSSRLQLVRQIIDSIPYNVFNETLDFAYLKSNSNKLNIYLEVSKSVDKLLDKVKTKLTNDDLDLPSNLDDFLESIHKDILNGDKDFFFLRSSDYLNLGKILLLKQGYGQAIDFFDKALEINRLSYDACIFKGLAFWYTQEYDKAIESFDNALKINRRKFSAWNNKSAVFFDKFQSQKNDLSNNEKQEIINSVLDFANQAIKINPKAPVAYVNKGCACSELKLYDQELECYQKALEIDDSFTLAWYNQACYYASRVNNKEEAIKSLTRAIDLNEDIKKYVHEEDDFDNIRNAPEFKRLVN